MRSVKSTQVILLYNINRLGKTSSVVTVKPGYAKNYLIPNGLAFYATKQNIVDFEKNKDIIVKQNSEKHVIAATVQAVLNRKYFTFVCNASDDGRLYGSVSVKSIADMINAAIIGSGIKDFSINASNINVGHGIKFIGSHIAKVSIYDGIDSEVSIVTCRSEADAESFIAKIENS